MSQPSYVSSARRRLKGRAAGLLDELEPHAVPVVLGGRSRLFDDLQDAEAQLEQVRAVEAPGVTHLKYRAVT